MLGFFRRYQKIFFLFITVVIVISFVFFGTYQAVAPAFRSQGDKEDHVTQMARFLNTEQWMISRSFFTCNFLNDGVISKEFIETGIADLFVAACPERFQADFEQRHEKEKNFTPYTHPYLPTLSALSLWSIFAPDIPEKLEALQKKGAGVKERNALFIAQKNFPPAFLSQIIRYQEQNNPQIPADPRLAKEDNSIFGYHDLTDWYGENFLKTASELIVQTAFKARKMGYKVSKDEILAELVGRSQEVFSGLKGKVTLPVEDGYGLFQLYLRQNGISEQEAIAIWEDVTLFRRLMHAVGDGALVDTVPLSRFYAYAHENVLVEVVKMPSDLKLSSMEDLKRLEVYLAAVGGEKNSALDIPQNYAPLATIEAKTPELVGRRYLIHYTETSLKSLQSKVTIKEAIQWKSDPENWKVIKNQFPELVQKQGTPFDILESLDEKTKRLVDTFARKKIVEQHPEWIHQILQTAPVNEKEVFLGLKSKAPFDGISDVKKFAALLDAQEELSDYTQDGHHYYHFLIKERGEGKEVLTYKEALRQGILDQLVTRFETEALLQDIVDATPAPYKKEAYAYRFAELLQKYKEGRPQGKLASQFPIDRHQKTITRAEPSFISIDDVLVQQAGSFSKIRLDPIEGAYLYKFIEKKVDTTLPLDKLLKCQELLSQEARCCYFESIIKSYISKQV